MRVNRTYVHSTSKLFLFLALVGLFSCQPDDQSTGVAAGASGRYVVMAYIVSGDTLFSLLPGSTGYKPGINKIDVDNFTIEMNVTGPDQLTVRTDYWRNGLRSTFSKEVVVRLTNYDYQFSPLNTNASSVYEGRVGRFTGFFYERAEGSVAIPAAGSPTNPNQSVVIIAQRAK